MGPFGVFGARVRDRLRGSRALPEPENLTPSQLLELASTPIRIFLEPEPPSPQEEFYARLARVKAATDKALYGPQPK